MITQFFLYPPARIPLCILLVMALSVSTAFSQPISFCGAFFRSGTLNPAGDSTLFYDRFGNIYGAGDLDGGSYQQDVVMEECNSGIFTLQFGLAGNVPAWTMNE
ncbi:MAG: hypothetical protein L6Q97_14905, partial [Thermoanaerobaculia bacterium]|nr:hypothetical protein [Thermoanaerobaculia bacterium]